jgi:hypothetical protein
MAEDEFMSRYYIGGEGCKTIDSNLMMNPISPTAPIPKKQILIDNQSSFLPGFIASFNVLVHWDKNDLKPMVQHSHNILAK